MNPSFENVNFPNNLDNFQSASIGFQTLFLVVSVFMEMKEGSVVFDIPQYPEMMNKLVH